MKRLPKLILAGILCSGLLAPSLAIAGGGSDTSEDPGVFFEPANSFFGRYSLTSGDVELSAFLTNTAGYLPVSGDWDGDGVDGIGIFNVTTGGFFLVDDYVDSPSAPLPADYSFFITTDGTDWLPFAGDWDGVGGDGIGIYNVVSGAMFLVNDVTATTPGQAAPADLSLFMVIDGPNWLPMAGGWDGAAADGVGVYNKTTGAMFLAVDATQGPSAPTPAVYSIFMDANGADYLPVAGDWNDNGSDGVGIYRTSDSSGSFFLANDATQGPSAAAPAEISLFIQGGVSPLGGPGFFPVVGYWGAP